jgi:hypothetical protein
MEGPPVRLYTLAEANAEVPGLERHFAAARGHVRKARAVGDQVQDLELVWGSKLLADGCPGRGEYLKFREELRSQERAVDALVKEITDKGVEVKDVLTGLTDFRARRGDNIVYLCWKPGEPQVGWWHTLQAGFAGRQPISTF